MIELRRRHLMLALGASMATMSLSGVAAATVPPDAPAPTTEAAPTEVPQTTATQTTATQTTATQTTATQTTAEPIAATPTTAASTTVITTIAVPTTAAETTTAVPVPQLPSVMLAGNAACDPGQSETTVTWRVTNRSELPVVITDETAGVPFDPNLVSPFRSRSATEVIDGPETDQVLSNTVTIDLGDGVTTQLTDTITAAACEGPAQLPEVTFTFDKTASVPVGGGRTDGDLHVLWPEHQ